MADFSSLSDELLEDELESKKQQIAELSSVMFELAAEVRRRKSRFAVGDFIQWNRGKSVAVGQVTKLLPAICNKVDWRVRRVRKDGTFGSTVTVSDWDKPEPASNFFIAAGERIEVTG